MSIYLEFPTIADYPIYSYHNEDEKIDCRLIVPPENAAGAQDMSKNAVLELQSYLGWHTPIEKGMQSCNSRLTTDLL